MIGGLKTTPTLPRKSKMAAISSRLFKLNDNEILVYSKWPTTISLHTEDAPSPVLDLNMNFTVREPPVWYLLQSVSNLFAATHSPSYAYVIAFSKVITE